MTIPEEYFKQAVNIYGIVCREGGVSLEDAKANSDVIAAINEMPIEIFTAVVAGYLAAVPMRTRQQLVDVVNENTAI